MKAETLPVTLEEFSMTRQPVAGEAVQGPTAGDVAMLLAQYRKAVDGRRWTAYLKPTDSGRCCPL